jgi:hypothetical protein
LSSPLLLPLCSPLRSRLLLDVFQANLFATSSSKDTRILLWDTRNPDKHAIELPSIFGARLASLALSFQLIVFPCLALHLALAHLAPRCLQGAWVAIASHSIHFLTTWWHLATTELCACGIRGRARWLL